MRGLAASRRASPCGTDFPLANSTNHHVARPSSRIESFERLFKRSMHLPVNLKERHLDSQVFVGCSSSILRKTSRAAISCMPVMVCVFPYRLPVGKNGRVLVENKGMSGYAVRSRCAVAIVLVKQWSNENSVLVRYLVIPSTLCSHL